ncbi:MAG: hypothetical protein H8D75_00600 [Rhodospirillaceae bacterium]|nr:hypothetical protein [Rhodospirillaceae bacterium]MBL6931351.1 hypothetical protein [Rhodospirillales bacterium]
MIDVVNLTAAAYQALQTQQRTAALIDNTTENISTGRKVNRAQDNPTDYFQARELSNRASDLLAVKNSIGQGLSTIEAASIGLRSLNQTIDQLGAIVSSIRGASDEERLSTAAIFDQVVSQLDQLASDSSYSGVSLISGLPQDLSVTISDDGEALTVSGEASDQSGLGIGSAASEYDDFATNANIDAALADLDAASAAIRAREHSFLSNLSVLDVREQFAQDLSDTLQAGSDNLVNANLEEEAATFLALQVRQKLGNVTLNLISEKNNAIASLF